ncbi:hypothetical protein Hdeb2414_s0001g00014411 [Helianthus debilis subsp. tardiflorus]
MTRVLSTVKKHEAKKRKIKEAQPKKTTKQKNQKTTEAGMKKGKTETEKNVRDPLLFSIRTRSSRRKMHECVQSLNEKQRKIVCKMGFGKTLSLKIDTIPGKLAYFVVDHFDPNKIEIRFGRIAIKVDEEAIHQFLGLPNTGFDVSPFKPPKENNTTLGKAYKKA